MFKNWQLERNIFDWNDLAQVRATFGGGVFWIRQWNFCFHKLRVITWAAQSLSAKPAQSHRTCSLSLYASCHFFNPHSLVIRYTASSRKCVIHSFSFHVYLQALFDLACCSLDIGPTDLDCLLLKNEAPNSVETSASTLSLSQHTALGLLGPEE